MNGIILFEGPSAIDGTPFVSSPSLGAGRERWIHAESLTLVSFS